MISLSEAAQIAYEERTGNTEPITVECPSCGQRWSAPTRWGDITDDADDWCWDCELRAERV